MRLFRRNTIFHAEDNLPDPEELKLRLRRRILIFTALIFLSVLGYPVARELQPELRARSEMREFAELLLEARTLASNLRSPVGLEQNAQGGWVRRVFEAGESCEKPAVGPSAEAPGEGFGWKLQAQLESGETVSGEKLCWHPLRGLLLDNLPLAQGQLLVSLIGGGAAGQSRDLAQLLVSEGGADFETLVP